MNTFNPRKAILAGLLGLGTVAGFGSGIASMAGCGGHRRAEHAQWAQKHHGAACDQRAAKAAPAAAAAAAPAPDAPAPTPPETAPTPVPPEAAPAPTPVEPGQE